MVLDGAFKPAWEGIQAARFGLQHFLLGILEGPFLLEENGALRSQLKTAAAHEETHRQLFEENARLRSLLEFKDQAPWKLIPAQVMGREFGLLSRTLLLNKGERDRIRVGEAVITPVGLAGRISEVGPSSSRMILITDPHFRVAATVSHSRISGLMVGTTSGDCILTYLPKGAELKVGETVLTSGGRSFCPARIPVGTIREVRDNSSELFRLAPLRPAVDGSAIDEVLVVGWTSQDP